jgi:hypothetical protein
MAIFFKSLKSEMQNPLSKYGYFHPPKKIL